MTIKSNTGSNSCLGNLLLHTQRRGAVSGLCRACCSFLWVQQCWLPEPPILCTAFPLELDLRIPVGSGIFCDSVCEGDAAWLSWGCTWGCSNTTERESKIHNLGNSRSSIGSSLWQSLQIFPQWKSVFQDRSRSSVPENKEHHFVQWKCDMVQRQILKISTKNSEKWSCVTCCTVVGKPGILFF